MFASILALMAGLAPTMAHAQQPDPASAKQLGQAAVVTKVELGGPRQTGSKASPVPLGNLKPSFSTVDVSLEGTLGPLTLSHHYTGDGATWSVNNPLQGESLAGPWWHSLYSYVDIRPHVWVSDNVILDEEWVVREAGGGESSFLPCFDVGCETGTMSWGSYERLRRVADGFVLYKPGQGVYRYHQHWEQAVGTTNDQQYRHVYYLNSIEDLAGRTLVTLSYDTSGLSPVLQEAMTPEGIRLRFHGSGLESWIELVDRQGSVTEVVSYEFVEGVYTKRRTKAGGGYMDVMTFGHGDATPSGFGSRWEVTAGGDKVVQLLDPHHGYITSDSDSTGTRTVTALSPSFGQPQCAPGQLSTYDDSGGQTPPCDTAQYQNLRQDFSTSGAGVAGAGTFSQRNLIEMTKNGPLVKHRTETFTRSGGMTSSRDWDWSWTMLPSSVTRVPASERGPAGDYAHYVFASGPNGPELTSLYTGAQAADGTGALAHVDFSYVNGAPTVDGFVERLLQSKSRASVMVPGQSATTYYRYDAHNRLTANFNVGYTRKLQGSSWVTVPRTIGTFFFTRYDCAGDATEDALDRVVEVHGPCEVAGTGALDCNEGEPVPVTQLEYYPDDAPLNDAHRLYKVRVYADGTVNGCGAHGLETTFADYDARGRALKSVDPNGTTTRFVFDGDRLLQTQRGESAASMQTTTYGYDDEAHRQLWARHPSGEYDVTCYREGTTPQGGCVGGTASSRLQWTARSLSLTGAGFTAAVKYTYVDGRLKQEQVLDHAGQVQRHRRYDTDGFGRRTFEATGDVVTRRGFDAADHLSRLGLPYNAAPAFCVTEDEAYRPCAEMDHDRLGRLSEMREYATTGVDSKASSCVSYDAQGNLSRWASGCTTSCAQCLADDTAAAVYTHDDFGQLVQVSAPWLQEQSVTTKTPGGAVKLEYNARGQVVKKQLPSQAMAGRYEAYAYDTLGRLTQAQVISSAGVELLQSNVYGDVAVDSECAPYQDPATAHLFGRVASLVDGSGKTCFSYDERGQVTRAARVVHPSEHVNALTRQVGAMTEQSFDTVGRLTSQRYPDGRRVYYTYWTDASGGESIDSVRAISIDVRSADGTTTVIPVVQNIHWDPSGGLRSYELVMPTGAPGITVEYLSGSGSAVASDTTCAMARPSGVDGTGRIEGLWVSRQGGTSGAGNVYKARYGWSADQMVAQAECVLSTSAQQPARVVAYTGWNNARGYDATLQLTHTRETRSASAPALRNDFTYDRRGNRTDSVESNNSFGYVYSAAGDQLYQRLYQPAPPWDEGDEPTFGGKAYNYNRDGLGYFVVWTGLSDYIENQGHPDYEGFGLAYAYFNYGASPGRSPTYVNARTSSENISAYQYRYDATGRRVQKEYHSGTGENAVDELFWSGTQLLEDRGNARVKYTATDARTVSVDQYIWLAGRPVVMIKSEAQVGSAASPSLSPRQDFVGSCTRNGENAKCGVYFVVNDPMGRPVVMLDGSGNVAGTGEYTPFGQVNREDRQRGTAHPLLEQLDDMGTLTVAKVPGLSTEVRARLPYVDIGTMSWLAAQDSSGNVVSWWDMGDEPGGPLVTSWVPLPTSGDLGLVVHNEGGWSGSEAPYGAALDSVEYRRHEPGVVPVWTRLRMPGQYYDPETDLVDNWHRVYDPSSGRFLAPDPMLLSPKYVAETLAKGQVPRVYAYANNNPIAFTDPTGLSTEEELAKAKKGLGESEGKLAKVKGKLDALAQRAKLFGERRAGAAWDKMTKEGLALLAEEDALKIEVEAGKAEVGRLEAKLARMKSLRVVNAGSRVLGILGLAASFPSFYRQVKDGYLPYLGETELHRKELPGGHGYIYTDSMGWPVQEAGNGPEPRSLNPHVPFTVIER